jgi:uncharacterized membrane protein YraQ (UPF0718 family)
MIESIQNFIWLILSKLHYWFQGSYTQAVAVSAWDLFRQLWYYLAAGIILTTLASIFFRKSQIASFFEKTGKFSIVTAALIGIVSPLGTYTVIPLIAGLLAIGVPAPPLVAFLISSPLMNPNLFVLTAGGLGYGMAIARVISALVLGVGAGLITQKLISKKLVKQFTSTNGGSALALNLVKEDRNSLTTKFFINLLGITKFVGKYFLLAILIAAAIKSLVPASWIIKALGSNNLFAIPMAVGAGVPLYTCGGAAIPVMKVLEGLGMNKGAILAFFISGPATKLSTLVALKATMQRSVILIYLGVTLVGAIVLGYLYSLL